MEKMSKFMKIAASYVGITSSAYLMVTSIDNTIVRVQRTPLAGTQERLDRRRENYTLTHKKQIWITGIGMASGYVICILPDGRHRRSLWFAGAVCCTCRFVWTKFFMEPESKQLMANDVLKSKVTGKVWVKETLDKWYKHDIVKITTSWLAFNFMLAALWEFTASSDDGFSFFALWGRTLRIAEVIIPYLSYLKAMVL